MSKMPTQKINGNSHKYAGGYDLQMDQGEDQNMENMMMQDEI